MTVFDEIRDSLAEMPDCTRSVPADILEGLEFGVSLAKLIGDKTDLKMQRTFFIRIASMAVQGVEVVDAMIEAADTSEETPE